MIHFLELAFPWAVLAFIVIALLVYTLFTIFDGEI